MTCEKVRLADGSVVMLCGPRSKSKPKAELCSQSTLEPAATVKRRSRSASTNTTSKRGRTTTSTASKINPPPQSSSPSPTDSALFSSMLQWQQTGYCGECCRPIESQQYGGLNPRHVDDKTRLCSKREAVQTQRGADICEMRPRDEALIAKLDRYNIDPRDHRHWQYVKDVVGGGHRVFVPQWPDVDQC